MTRELADLVADESGARSEVVVQTLVEVFDPLMRASPDAFRAGAFAAVAPLSSAQ